MKHEANCDASCCFFSLCYISLYFVTGCRAGASEIAASGARALLAMTNLIGFAGNRSNFRNETFEIRCGERYHAKRPHKRKTSVYKQNRRNFVSLRGAKRRGNLKAGGMGSRNEEREHEPRCGTRDGILCMGQLARFNCCPGFFEHSCAKKSVGFRRKPTDFIRIQIISRSS